MNIPKLSENPVHTFLSYWKDFVGMQITRARLMGVTRAECRVPELYQPALMAELIEKGYQVYSTPKGHIYASKLMISWKGATNA